MFDFFDSSSFAEPKVSLDHFREWSGAITSAYLKSGADPTSEVIKVASAEELTPDQIKILAGEVNKSIHTAKYASAKDKYLAADFPLADAAKAITSLQAGGQAKLAAQMPAPAKIDEGPDAFEMFGVKPETTVKTAELKHECHAAHQKTALLKQKLGDKVILEKNAADAAEAAFIKTARQMVIVGANSGERMKTLGSIDHFAKCASAEFRTLSRKPLAKLSYVLQKEGLLEPAHAKTALAYFLSKEADCKAPEELISEWLPARVVNGDHPLYITLKTFRDHVARMNEARGNMSIVDDRLSVLGQKVRAL